MRFLHPDQIAHWYKRSLQKSGYKELFAFARDFWKDLVRRGSYAIPPGFVARLMERFLSVPVGEKEPAQIAFTSEDEYLDKIHAAEGADRLEGIFLLTGADRDTVIAQGIFQQIIERLPPFQHDDLVFSDSDLEKSFTLGHMIPGGFDVETALEKIYARALDDFARTEFRFYADDVFEIGHPGLFKRPADRLFFRRMTRTMKGLNLWTRSVFTLKEESSWVVAKYGEPNVLPLGGYEELSNKGNLSSLVPSELAYIDESMAFDLFDYKFIENQLTYFKRDTGAVFRIRRDVLIKVSLTEFCEHERHLGMLFAYCFNFAEKLIETFVKDMVQVVIALDGYKPSSLHDACEFFGHFLHEKSLDTRIRLVTGLKNEDIARELRENSQNWVFAARNPGFGIHVSVDFPQSDEFAAMNADEQERILGNLINGAIERMVKNADSES
ncbi:MAG: hypothetical protein CVV41_06355 [Candidatus Riflebacteria bacterium HGW-Riflebacteria-1]|jgi:hypothetical protein|nr:MAG: hypothetical protein CVV41_06355 [Candidatus Riflebacteria bacterium HGW-Riflebacteria-1]